ncbi:unnamed protein product [Brassicogethes aeneus]|uniref:Uncharacterized protein n=1 Tax=Brassicogethes aeneus TaxID=1431903 RepID=A0A9P0AWM6_BRAAE|nr:unnamed protein product [Brassicogethes aeneus]
MFFIGISNNPDPLQFAELLNEIETQQQLNVTPLHLAAAHGELDLVNTLLAEGFDINSQTKHKRLMPLDFAIQENRLEIVKFLIAHGADVNHKIIKGFTPLSFASQQGCLDIVNTLIDNGADLNTKTDELNTPLHIAAQNGHLNIVNVFIEKGLDINAANNDRLTPLHLAVQSGNLKVIKALISHGSDINAGCSSMCNTRVETNITPLLFGVQSGRLDIVKALLEAGANVNAKTGDKITPLHVASQKGFLELVDILLKAKSNANAKDHNNYTPLHLAAERNQFAVIKSLLLVEGIDVNAKNHLNSTALHMGSQLGHIEVVKLLIEKKANVNAKKNKGFTPLHLAIQQKHFELSDFLIKNGANINITDDQGCTPLHFVAHHGNLEVAKLFLAKGADINAKTIESYTPLHLAVDNDHLKLVKWLLKNGADVNALDNKNRTPLHMAAQHGFDKIATVLLKHGASVNLTKNQRKHLAAKYGQKVVKTLVKNGADFKNIQLDKNPFSGSEFDQQQLPSTPPKVRVQKAEATISKPEPELPENKRLAREEKEQGNAFYKKKEFDEAIARYRKAIEHDPTDITFYNNLAAVHFEQKEFEKCVKECEKGIEIGRENRADFKLIAKSFMRIGNAYKRMKKYESAKTCYEKSLTEHRTPEAESLLSDVEKVIKEEEIKANFDMELAEKEKEKGNELFKKGDFAAALKHYCEAIKRNLDDAKLYSNRAACYMKLGLEDCDKCVELDPKFLKGFIRKGHILQGMQQQEKAIFAFLKALEIDPNNAEALHGLRACIIENSNLEGDQNSEKIWQRVKHDPEVQAILKLPAMRRILEQMQNDVLCQIS